MFAPEARQNVYGGRQSGLPRLSPFRCSWIDAQFFDNKVAGLHILGSNNFTFEATFGPYEDEDGSQGNVGSLDGQQPIEVIVESSNLVTFTDVRVRSANGES